LDLNTRIDSVAPPFVLVSISRTVAEVLVDFTLTTFIWPPRYTLDMRNYKRDSRGCPGWI
jgi:hypothetical protein